MSDAIEQEVLSSGAMASVRKPISPDDLNDLSNKRNGNSDMEGSNSLSGSTNNSKGRDRRLGGRKKRQIRWTSPLRDKFLQAIKCLGLSKAVPNKILKFMDVKGLTRTHVASYLQKYRKYLKRVKDAARKLEIMSSVEMNSNFESSSSYINPQSSYNYNTSLSKNNLFSSQLGYGLGQSSRLTVNNNVTYDSSHIRSNLLPMRGSLRFSNGTLPLNEDMRSVFGTSQASQVPWPGQYGTTSNLLGMISNPVPGYMPSNYVGIRINENGDLVGAGGMRVNGNGSLGENSGAINWNINNNMSNHESSSSRFASAFPSFLDSEGQPQSNLTAQMNGVVSVLKDLCNDHHHGINQVFGNTTSSQFDQSQQHQGNVTGTNLELSEDDFLEMNSILAASPLEDITNWSFDTVKDNSNEETLISIAANSEMYFPTPDNNIINQDWDGEDDFMKYLLELDMP